MNASVFSWLLKPYYWPWWGIIVLFWGMTRLAYRWQLAIGRQLGRWVYYFAPRRRHIASVNLHLCFPSLTEPQHQALLHRHFESLGMGLLEMLSAWWQSPAFFASLWQIEGLEHLQTALARGQGVILLSAHFHALEVGGRFVSGQTAIHAVYRAHEHPVIEYLFKHNREKHAEKAIARENMREVLQSLRLKKTLWLAIDQNYGHKHSVFADFFAIPAATNTVLSRLGALSDAVIIPFFTRRLHHTQGGYKIVFYPPLTLSGHPQTDATQINQLLEMEVRKAPEQYWWLHRRFKDRPAGAARFY